MSKVRVIYNADKTVKIVYPVSASKKKNETEEQWLNRVFNKVTSPDDVFDDIDKSELPTTDRGGWEGEKGKGVWINQDKIQTIRDAAAKRRLIEQEKELLAVESLKKKGLI